MLPSMFAVGENHARKKLVLRKSAALEDECPGTLGQFSWRRWRCHFFGPLFDARGPAFATFIWTPKDEGEELLGFECLRCGGVVR